MKDDEFAHVWKEKFPEAKVYCPEALVEVRSQKRGVVFFFLSFIACFAFPFVSSLFLLIFVIIVRFSLCPQEMGKGVSVEGSIEKSMDALENYGFKSCMNCQSWCAFDDCFLKVETETIEGKSATALISCCGVGNAPRSIFKPIEFFYGFLGLRIFRQFALVFTKDLKAARDFVNKMASIPEIDFVLFQHGQPLRGEAANAHLKNVYISRSFFSY
uniref:Uncharacterized protein n=1 Tax=Lotharella globosa TaxID=91324 RepID=A0A7S4DKS2_9EUKA